MKDQQQQPQGRLLCAWCGRDLGPSGTVEDSRGICEACERKYFKRKEAR